MTDPNQAQGTTPPGADATTVLPSDALEGSEVDQLRAELAAAEAKAADNWSAYLRIAAELDNYRKRAAREAEQARQYGIERFAGELLAGVDSLELGYAASEKADAAAIREGLEATLRLFARAFEKSGITTVDPQGKPFDPAEHEAMVMQPSDAYPANTVLTVVQKGYLLNGRLLRPARVIVSKAPDA